MVKVMEYVDEILNDLMFEADKLSKDEINNEGHKDFLQILVELKKIENSGRPYSKTTSGLVTSN